MKALGVSLHNTACYVVLGRALYELCRKRSVQLRDVISVSDGSILGYQFRRDKDAALTKYRDIDTIRYINIVLDTSVI